MADPEIPEKDQKPKIGPPEQYPDELMFEIIRRHEHGENVLKILREPGMPSFALFYRRVGIIGESKVELFTAYERAHKAWAMHRLLEVDEIANEQEMGEDETVTDGPKGTTVSRRRSDMLGHRTLKVKTRQWFAERILAHYAAKQAFQNPDGSPLIVPVINVKVLP